MNIKLFILMLFMGLLACKADRENFTPGMKNKPKSEMAFDKEKWSLKECKTYPYRDKMLNAVLYSDTLRTLNENEITQLLGQPDRLNQDFIYYRVKQTRLLFWPLHTRSLVLKFNDDSTIQWIKVHE